MKKLTLILAGVLAAQMVLTAILFSLDSDMSAFQSKEKLLGLDLAELDSIDIESPDKKLSLTKNQDQWQLINHFNAPVNRDKLQQMTDKLFALNTSWPVATTASAAPRFKVSSDEFERKISFRKDSETLKTLFLGSSPGFKKIHARIDPDDEIYSINFSAFEAAANPDDWIDKSLLKINEGDLTKITLNKFTLAKTDQVWNIEELPATKTASQEKITNWINKLTNLGYNSILGTENKPEYGFSKPELTLKLIQKSGKPIELQLAKKENEFIIKSSDQPYYFKAAQYQVQELLDASLDKLTEDNPEPAKIEVEEQADNNQEP